MPDFPVYRKKKQPGIPVYCKTAQIPVYRGGKFIPFYTGISGMKYCYTDGNPNHDQ